MKPYNRRTKVVSASLPKKEKKTVKKIKELKIEMTPVSETRMEGGGSVESNNSDREMSEDKEQKLPSNQTNVTVTIHR